MALVPPIAVMLSKLNLVDDYDLRSVKVVLCAAAPLSPEVVEKLIHKFGWELMQGFGMTESLCTHVTPRGEKRLEKPGSVGLLMPFSEAKVIFYNFYGFNQLYYLKYWIFLLDCGSR